MRYYIDLNGATNVEGTYTLTVQIVPDPTPPIASIVLAGGRYVVNNPTLLVDVQAYDDLSGVPSMAFSQNGTTWTDWRPLAFHATWTFPSGDGLKTLWTRSGARARPVEAQLQRAPSGYSGTLVVTLGGEP